MANSTVIKNLSMITAIAALITLVTSTTADALVIDFEEHSIQPGHNEDIFSSITSKGFLLAPEDEKNTQFALANDVFEAQNQTTYFVVRDLVAEDTLTPFLNPLIISQVNGSPFSLLSFDIAEWGEPKDQAKTVEVTGYLAGGGSVFQSITFSTRENVGFLGNFQKVTFDQNWSNLTSVVFKGTGAPSLNDIPGFHVNSFALDNIQVGEAVEPEPVTVPEPTITLSVLAFGAFGVAYSTAKRKSKVIAKS